MPIVPIPVSSKPYIKAMEMIESGTGVLVEPWRIRRRAKAEAEARVEQAKAEGLAMLELDAAKEELALRRRARARNRAKEVRRERNIEAIEEEIFKALPAQVSDQPVDRDWANFFFESCEDVSDEQMRKLWGKIGAAEIAQPSTFSRRTLSIVKHLSAGERAAFENILRFVWRSGGTDAVPLVPSRDSISELEQFGLQYADLLSLESAGLIHLEEASQEIPERTPIICGLQVIHFEQKLQPLEVLPLTSAGFELGRVVMVLPHAAFHEWTIQRLESFGPACPWPDPAEDLTTIRQLRGASPEATQ